MDRRSDRLHARHGRALIRLGLDLRALPSPGADAPRRDFYGTAERPRSRVPVSSIGFLLGSRDNLSFGGTSASNQTAAPRARCQGRQVPLTPRARRGSPRRRRRAVGRHGIAQAAPGRPTEDAFTRASTARLRRRVPGAAARERQRRGARSTVMAARRRRTAPTPSHGSTGWATSSNLVCVGPLHMPTPCPRPRRDRGRQVRFLRRYTMTGAEGGNREWSALFRWRLVSCVSRHF